MMRGMTETRITVNRKECVTIAEMVTYSDIILAANHKEGAVVRFWHRDHFHGEVQSLLSAELLKVRDGMRFAVTAPSPEACGQEALKK